MKAYESYTISELKRIAINKGYSSIGTILSAGHDQFTGAVIPGIKTVYQLIDKAGTVTYTTGIYKALAQYIIKM